MTQQTLVALFHSIKDADAARRQLEAAGIPAADLHIQQGPIETAAATRSETAHQEPSFLQWLFGARPSQDEIERYRSHVAQGGAALTVRADDRDVERISKLLEQHDLVAIEEAREYDTGTDRAAGASGAETATEETALPTAREELAVGKRQVSGAKTYRIRRYVVERPAEERVALHDETVEVERRTAAGSEGERPFEEKVVEVTETHEEPVVSKRVVPGEEVVVRKKEGDRVETVRDTVRESRVEVDRAAAGDKPRDPSAPPTGGSR